MKRLCIIILAVLTALLLAFFASWYLSTYPAIGGKAAVPEQAELSAREAALGAPVTATLAVELPRYRNVEKAEAEAGDGAVLSGKVEVTWEGFHATRSHYRVRATLSAYRPGNVQPGKLRLTLSPEKGSKAEETITAVIPDFKAVPGEAVEAGAPELADELAAPPEPYRYWPWLLLLLPLAAVIWWLARPRKRAAEKVLPPWERARTALEELRRDLKSRALSPEGGFARLTDLVRNYLEERFHLPASKRTTAEFLTSLETDATLPEENRPFLRDFLTRADEIKFARAPAGDQQLTDAIDSAETLVQQTVPLE